MPTVPSLPVCVHSTICLPAPITKELCQPLSTKFLVSHSYVTSLCGAAYILCLLCDSSAAPCSLFRVCFEGCVHFWHHILYSCILVFSTLFPGSKVQQDCNFHSHCDLSAFFLSYRYRIRKYLLWVGNPCYPYCSSGCIEHHRNSSASVEKKGK